MSELQKDQKTYGVGFAIPQRRQSAVVVKIDQAKVAELQKWSAELRQKFEAARK